MDFFLKKNSIIKGQTKSLPFYCFLDKLQFVSKKYDLLYSSTSLLGSSEPSLSRSVPQ